jgi:hypothetical protein
LPPEKYFETPGRLRVFPGTSNKIKSGHYHLMGGL